MQANAYYDALSRHFAALADNPLMHPAVDDIRHGYRRRVCGSDSVYYCIEGGTVEIMAIIDNVIHHSYQGAQYTSIAFGQRCRQDGVRPPMGSVGDCFDNAMCESFFGTLECELIDRSTSRTQAEARLAVFDFIEGFYNPHRRHSAINYLLPIHYDKKIKITDEIKFPDEIPSP